MAMRRLYPAFDKLAHNDGIVLIEGEAGTGKELVAEEIHRASGRAEATFIVLEASAIPSDEIGTRLFGEGGLIERAKGGVLFIDEIGDVPRHAQKKLTRAHHRRRVGCASHRRDEARPRSRRHGRPLRRCLLLRARERPRRASRVLKDRHGDVPLLAKHFLA